MSDPGVRQRLRRWRRGFCRAPIGRDIIFGEPRECGIRCGSQPGDHRSEHALRGPDESGRGDSARGLPRARAFHEGAAASRRGVRHRGACAGLSRDVRPRRTLSAGAGGGPLRLRRRADAGEFLQRTPDEVRSPVLACPLVNGPGARRDFGQPAQRLLRRVQARCLVRGRAL